MGGAILIVDLFEKVGFRWLRAPGGLGGVRCAFSALKANIRFNNGIGGEGGRGGVTGATLLLLKKRPHLLTLLSLLTCFRNIASKATMNVAIGAIQQVQSN